MSILINLFFSETFLLSILIILFGLGLRFILTLCNQVWVTTYHHTMTFMILPFTTYIITKLISGNIALSLGMVGALSIVRFRNPVKNSFELVMFFALITLGISGTVGYLYTISYFTILSAIIIFAFIIEKIYEKNNKKLFSFSFNEGEKSPSLTVCTDILEPAFLKNPLLISSMEDIQEKKFIYRFASKNIEDLKIITENYKKTNFNNITSIEYVKN